MQKKRTGAKNPLEVRVRTRARRDSIRNGLLSAIALTGALPLAIAAPKVFTALSDLGFDAYMPSNPKQRLYETASRLKRKGLIEFRSESGKRRMVLTDAGRVELLRGQAKLQHRQKPKKWDRRWRIVIFDIPEKRRNERDRIRVLMRSFGFERLQDSVWIYPYDCEEIITLYKTDLRLGRSTLYLVADALEFDRPLRERFGLPLVD